jgi:competence protein ComEC
VGKRAILCLAIVWLASVTAVASETLDVIFIDVGAGDAILIDCGDWEALLDAGPGSRTANEELFSVLSEHVSDGIIELAILSHPHADHYGGFISVLSRYDVWEFWRSTDSEPDTCDSTYSAFAVALLEANLVPSIRVRGDRSTSGPLEWVVLGPGELVAETPNDNENSLVLLLTYGAVRFLFAGNIETVGESALRSIELPEGCLILKLPDHGSATSTSVGLLDWTDPDLAILSTQDDTPAVAAVLADRAIPFWTTRSDGTIRVSTDGRTVWLAATSLPCEVVVCPAD